MKVENTMNIICVGDVVGDIGCEFLRAKLPLAKRYYGADFVIVNGENSNNTNGVTPKTADHIFSSGADVITTGNHVFQRKEIYDYLNEIPYIIRPANYPDSVPGNGFVTVDKVTTSVTVINLMGNVYMSTLDNPFHRMDQVMDQIDSPIVIVDFHAEATSEKIAFAAYMDGRVSAVVGTHTHVQTADERILPEGTGFITDLGMTGPKHSSLGVSLEPVIAKYRNYMPARFDVAKGPCIMCGVALDIDQTSGKTVTIERFQIE